MVWEAWVPYVLHACKMCVRGRPMRIHWEFVLFVASGN